MVYIKEISANSEEHRIAELLRQEEWTSDPRNHCVPILNLFKDPQDPELFYLVMPLLRPMNDPPFEQVKEIMEFTDQILEVKVFHLQPNLQTQAHDSQGLIFLHEKGIAHRYETLYPDFVEFLSMCTHRDCVRPNIMMNGDAMYPEGFHPIRIKRTPDCLRTAEHTSRTVAGVKYYYLDFGISCYLPDADSLRLVTGSDGRDQDPPELSDTNPYDPFKLDIFIIGNMLNQEFCRVGVFRRH